MWGSHNFPAEGMLNVREKTFKPNKSTTTQGMENDSSDRNGLGGNGGQRKMAARSTTQHNREMSESELFDALFQVVQLDTGDHGHFGPDSEPRRFQSSTYDLKVKDMGEIMGEAGGGMPRFVLKANGNVVQQAERDTGNNRQNIDRRISSHLGKNSALVLLDLQWQDQLAPNNLGGFDASSSFVTAGLPISAALARDGTHRTTAGDKASTEASQHGASPGRAKQQWPHARAYNALPMSQPRYLRLSKTTLRELECSQYHWLLREQIEIFESAASGQEAKSQKRRRQVPVRLWQLGIQCIHCAHLPPQEKKKGAVYFPTKLVGIYQASINMASIHLCWNCSSIPADLKSQLNHLRTTNSVSYSTPKLDSTLTVKGKKYWAYGCKMFGMVETPGGLFFRDRLESQEGKND